MTNQSDTSTKEPAPAAKELSCCRHGCRKIDHPIPFLVTACLHFLFRVASGSYFGGVISTLEKQFQFDSQMSGIIGIVSDASSFSVVLVVAYYGTKSNQPRIIGIGALVSSLGYFCCALPHFFNDLYQYKGTGAFEQKNTNQHLCNDSFTNSSSVEELWSPGIQRDNEGIGWLIIGNLLIGFGSAPLIPLALTYLDDSTIDPSTTSIYIACIMSMTSFGPLLGFFTSFKCLSLYVDFYRVNAEDQPAGFRDPSWLGAWWLGYILASVVFLILAIPMFLFPRHLTKYECAMCSRRNDDDGQKAKHKTVGVSFLKFDNASSGIQVIVDFFKAIWRLLKNPVLTFSFCVATCDLAIVGGFIFFVAKYVQLQFDVSPATASIIVGLTTAPGNIFGNIIGSFIVKKLNLKLKGLSIMLVCVCLLAVVFAIPVIFIGCSNPQISGVLQHGSQNELNVQQGIETCNTGCSCASGIYEPVCGSDGVTYLSACHAGCTTMDSGDNIYNETDEMTFSECSCIGETYVDGGVAASATEGACHFLCNKSIQFSVLVGIISMFASIRSNPSLMTVLRCVDDEDRGLAAACNSLVVRALGFLPSSLYFGAVISSSCIFRQETESGSGTCLIYDLEKYRYSFVGLFLGLKVTGAIFALCVLLSVKFWKIPRDMRAEKQREQEKKGNVLAENNGVLETVA